jgi:hypothetical protein
MTKKDYVLLAAVLLANKPDRAMVGNVPYNAKSCWYVWDAMVWRMIEMLKEDNPKFNATRFSIACGVEGVEE